MSVGSSDKNHPKFVYVTQETFDWRVWEMSWLPGFQGFESRNLGFLCSFVPCMPTAPFPPSLSSAPSYASTMLSFTLYSLSLLGSGGGGGRGRVMGV